MFTHSTQKKKLASIFTVRFSAHVRTADSSMEHFVLIYAFFLVAQPFSSAASAQSRHRCSSQHVFPVCICGESSERSEAMTERGVMGRLCSVCWSLSGISCMIPRDLLR